MFSHSQSYRGNGNTSNGVVDTINEHTSLLSRPLQNSDGVNLWEDERSYVKWPAQFLHVTWQTLISNYVNVLLVFVPLGIVAGAVGWGPSAIFILNFLAIIPLASLLSFATEEISVKLGQTLGGLLNATFGNAVELIVRSLLWIVMILLIGLLGQHSRSHTWRNTNCPVQYAWLHLKQHSSCPRMLFSGRRPSLRSSRIQSDHGLYPIVSYGRFNSVSDHTRRIICRDGSSGSPRRE